VSQFELFLQRFAFFGFGILSHFAFESSRCWRALGHLERLDCWGPESWPLLCYIDYGTSRLDVDDGLLDVERWTEMLRDVGFNSAPETAEDFIRSFIADRTVRGG
jgi:hypothetical protein